MYFTACSLRGGWSPRRRTADGEMDSLARKSRAAPRAPLSGCDGDATTRRGGMGDAAGVIVEGSLGGKSGVGLPGGEPPADLVIHDVSEGTGAPVDPGATVTAHSVGLGWSTG